MPNAENGLGLTHFPEPTPPYPNVLAYAHEHDLTMIGAQINPNGTWSSLWSCALCPDVFVGGKVGPVPPGTCVCGWVQKKWPRKKCEDCGRRVLPPGEQVGVEQDG